MFNAHHDIYQSTRLQDGLTIRQPAYHPRLQEGIQLDGTPSQVVYSNATMADSNKSSLPDLYPVVSSNGPISHYTTDPMNSLDVQTMALALEDSASITCMDFSQCDYGFQVLQSNDSVAIPSGKLSRGLIAWS